MRRSQLLCLGAANSSVRSEREGRVGENTGNEVEDLYYSPRESSVRSNGWLLTKVNRHAKRD